ncbi:MAG TPA: hypothetical protein VGJ86_04485 [Acidimicrobiales bacterium]|jgi:hypothetical protein
MAPAPRTAVRPDRASEGLRQAQPEERLRHLRVVGPRDRLRRSFHLTPRTGVTLTVLLFAALFAVAVSHALLVESQIHLDRLDDQVSEEESRYDRLREDLAELESPDRIVNDASAMGMVPPADVGWITPDQPADSQPLPGGVTTADESSDTSWEQVKPYLPSSAP